MAYTRPHAQFVKQFGQTFNAGYNVISWEQATVASGITLNTSNYSFTVSRAGTYHFDLGLRHGSGLDVWTGCSCTDVSGNVIAKSYGTGQDGPAEGHSWHFLAPLEADTSYYIQSYRNLYGLAVQSPGD
eukprot:12402488-Karenia_brevis.AAC.1